jgi:hypothetical protein
MLKRVRSCAVVAAIAATAAVQAAQPQPGPRRPRVLDGGTPSGPPDVSTYEAAAIGAPPDALGLDPFYRQHADAFGIPIVASERVNPAALLLARDIVNYMLAKRPDVRDVLIARGSRVMIMALREGQLDLPEYRDWKKPAIDDRRLTPTERERYNQPGGIAGMTDAEYWNGRARGMGGVRTSCAEENLLGFPGTRYYGEHICVHEFSHGIMSAIRTADPALMAEIEAAYADAKANSRFKGHYAENTVAEYWAEGTQWWFWSNYAWNLPDGGGRLWTPESLQTYDPKLFDLLGRVYPGHHIPADIYHGRDVRAGR